MRPAFRRDGARRRPAATTDEGVPRQGWSPRALVLLPALSGHPGQKLAHGPIGGGGAALDRVLAGDPRQQTADCGVDRRLAAPAVDSLVLNHFISSLASSPTVVRQLCA